MGRPLSPRSRWAYAAKPASWPKLLVPTVFGQALAVAARGELDGLALFLGLAFTVFDLLFIVFWNDYFDRRVDAIKREMFPESGSPKTIPDAILPARSLLLAGACAGIAALAVALVAEFVLQRPGAGAFASMALLVFVAYSLPPLRLNYRGGGEWLEMFGVGVVLPLFQAYLQGGESVLEFWPLLLGFCLMSLASATASGLADERSDLAGGKHTFASERGNQAARERVERLTLWGALAWALGLRAAVSGLALWLGALSVVIVVVNWRRMRRCSAAATTDAFDAQRRYKALLHNALWRGALVLALALVVLGLRSQACL